jgi:transcriptional regulator with XRE-family HTH domain
MKAARKFKKFNQSDVAQAIGCSQSALSKMEHNLLIPNAPQWFLFSRFTSIPPETIETGVINRHSRVKLNNDNVSIGFKLPKRYRSNRSQKVREIYPMFSYLEKVIDGEEFIQFKEKLGIDLEFFVDFDNLVNFQLIVDLVNHYIRLEMTSPKNIQDLVNFGQDDLYWDDFIDKWKGLDGPQTVLAQFAQEQPFFQVDFKIQLEIGQNNFFLSYLPEAHVFHFLKDLKPETIEWLSLYRKLSLESLIEKTLGKKIEVRHVPSLTHSPLEDRFEIH